MRVSFFLCGLVAAIIHAEPDRVCPSIPRSKRHIVLTVDSIRREHVGVSVSEGLGFNKSTGGFGPELRLRLGEEVTIDVVNNLANVGTSVHWHGQDLGRDVWADGAAGLTQRIIHPVGCHPPCIPHGPSHRTPPRAALLSNLLCRRCSLRRARIRRRRMCSGTGSSQAPQERDGTTRTTRHNC
jgi:hypothetical protein